MKKNSVSLLSDQLNRSTVTAKDSFGDTPHNLSNEQVSILSDYLGRKIQASLYVHTRKLHLSSPDGIDFTITLGPLEQSRTVTYDLFLLQTTNRLYLCVASTFDLYELLNREPFQESVGEFRYQYQLGKMLGLHRSAAYESETLVSEETVVDNELELLYCGNQEQHFLIYSL